MSGLTGSTPRIASDLGSPGAKVAVESCEVDVRVVSADYNVVRTRENAVQDCEICLWACFGVALRYCISLVGSTSGIFGIFGSTWFFQNIVGTFVLGVLVTLAPFQNKRTTFHVSPGITTGFCGSLTTWSSWQQTISLYFLDANARFLDGLLCYVLGHAIFYLSYRGGIHTAEFALTGRKFKLEDESECSLVLRRHAYLIFGAFFLVYLFLIVAIIAFPSNRHVFIGIFLGGWGAIIRHRLSKRNRTNGGIPYFTLLANVLGSIFVAIVSRLCVHSGHSSVCDRRTATENWAIQVGAGGILGFGGSLTTVSTYISEVHKMKNRYAMYSYMFMAFTATQTSLFIINGLF